MTVVVDRTVHARSTTMEVVRYERAGKWYLEPRNGTKRQHVNIDQAAQYAVHADAEIYLGKPGGRAFDAKVTHRKGVVSRG